MFYCFQRRKISSIQFQSMVLNLENKGRIQDKEIEGNRFAYR